MKTTMNKIIVLHDTVNGKLRVVEVSAGATYCTQCSLVPLSGDVCELYYRGSEFHSKIYGDLMPECSFKDVFEPEELKGKEPT